MKTANKILYRYTEKQYDGFGRMISEAEANCNGTAPSETDLSARRITYTYDNDDRLAKQFLIRQPLAASAG